MTRRRGFTLLEVLVAVAILGLALTVILSSQAGLFASATHVEHLTMATNSARCRMSEVEEKLLREGYPLLDENDEGPCCEDEAESDLRCSWKIERIELPMPRDPLELVGGGADGGAGVGASTGLGPLGTLTELQQTQGASLGGKAELSDLGGALTAAAAGGAQAMAPLVMGMVYPELKPMLEASIRKVTVTVSWTEGRTPRELEVTQYVTNPMQGGFDPTASDQLQSMADQAGGLLGGAASPGAAPAPTPRAGGLVLPRSGGTP